MTDTGIEDPQRPCPAESSLEIPVGVSPNLRSRADVNEMIIRPAKQDL